MKKLTNFTLGILRISTINWSLEDINNYCIQNNLSYDSEDEEIILMEVSVNTNTKK